MPAVCMLDQSSPDHRSAAISVFLFCFCAARQWRGWVCSHRKGPVYAHAQSVSLLFPKQSKATRIHGMSPPPKGQWGHCIRNHQAHMPESAFVPPVSGEAWSGRIGRARYMPMPCQPACFFQSRVEPPVYVECLHHLKGSGDIAQGITKPVRQRVPQPEV